MAVHGEPSCRWEMPMGKGAGGTCPQCTNGGGEEQSKGERSPVSPSNSWVRASAPGAGRFIAPLLPGCSSGPRQSRSDQWGPESVPTAAAGNGVWVSIGLRSGVPAECSPSAAASFLSFLVSSRKTRAGQNILETLSTGKERGSSRVWAPGSWVCSGRQNGRSEHFWGLETAGFALCSCCDQPQSK